MTREAKRLDAEKLGGPLSRQIRPDIVCTTEAGASYESDVRLLPNGGVGLQDWLMEILA